jgi:hypothetical protein
MRTRSYLQIDTLPGQDGNDVAQYLDDDACGVNGVLTDEQFNDNLIQNISEAINGHYREGGTIPVETAAGSAQGPVAAYAP